MIVKSGRTLAPAPVIELRDEQDKVVAKAGVTITAAIDGATLSGTTSATTGADGRATFGGMMVTGVPGVHALTFAASGIRVVTAAVTLQPAPVATMTALSPLLQNGIAGMPAAGPPSVRLLDSEQGPIQGGAVQFVVLAGDGALSDSVITTDENGVATMASWALGPMPALNELVAISGSDSIFFRAGAASVAPVSVSPLTPTIQAIMQGQELVSQPTVRVEAGAGVPVAGTLVVFHGSSPSGPVDDSISVSDAAGVAIARHWKPAAQGIHVLTASVPSVAVTPAQFSARVLRQGSIFGGGIDNQVALAGTSVAQLPWALVTSDGAPVPGVTVAFAVTAGGGVIGNTTAITDQDGVARLASWTLGAAPGRNEVTAAAPGFQPATAIFHSFGVASLPATLAIMAGDNQTAPILTPLPVNPAVRVTDAGGAPVVGYPITFAASGGRLMSGVAETDASGVASSGTWTMPPNCPAALTLTASAPQLTNSPQVLHASCTSGAPALIVKGLDSLRGQAGIPLSTHLTINVYDAGGNALSGIPVAAAVTTGNGSLSADPVTGTAGHWEAVWTLGTTAGNNDVTVTVASLPPVTFHAVGFGGPATSMEIVSGDMVSAPIYAAITATVHLTDQFGNDSPEQPVTFTTAGGGRVIPGHGAVTSDSGGRASIAWRLGGTAGSYSLGVMAPNGLYRSLTATAAEITSPFNIEVRYIGSPTQALEDAVTAAVARWRGIITADLPDVAIHTDAAACFDTEPALDETVDDIVVYIEVAHRDGVGGILGAAGPCLIRSVSELPALGYMTLDADDVDQIAATGELTDVVLHEMGHILGLGTLWQQDGLVINQGTSDPRYSGARAVAGYRDIGGRAPVIPLENGGGEGTAESHWRETIFGWELMTGYIASADNPLSRMTIGSLEDLGYSVDYTRADFMMMDPSLRAELRRAGRQLREARLPSPIVIVDPAGRVVGRRTRVH
jgi:hypothetical protein